MNRALCTLSGMGVRESVATEISGHKTRHVCDRYNIRDTADIREALIKVGEFAQVQVRRARRA